MIDILIADHSRCTSELLAHLLRKMGAHVDMVHTGDDALLAAHDHHYDMIFLELELPDIDGCEVTGILRDRGIDTPIMGVAAEDPYKVSEVCVQAGCNRFLAKPLTLRTLEGALADFLPLKTNGASTAPRFV
jgi:CheY-like chemotaxis protein